MRRSQRSALCRTVGYSTWSSPNDSTTEHIRSSTFGLISSDQSDAHLPGLVSTLSDTFGGNRRVHHAERQFDDAGGDDITISQSNRPVCPAPCHRGSILAGEILEHGAATRDPDPRMTTGNTRGVEEDGCVGIASDDVAASAPQAGAPTP